MNLPYTEGSLSAPLVLVGEAPGQIEERLGKPFVGPAGDLLNQCLHNAGLLRQQCYITNVLKFRPENNDASIYTQAKPGSAEHESYLRERGALLRELEHTNASLIVALGETAWHALVGTSGILKRRGSVQRVEIGGQDRLVLGVLHPAAALRTYIWRNLITWDLLRAKEILEQGWQEPQRSIILRPTSLEAIRYTRECAACDLIGFDIEVINEELYCYCLGKSKDDLMVIGLRDEGGDRYNPHEETEILRELGLLFEKTRVLGQNLNFDYTFMLNKYSMAIKQLEDTMIAQAILYPDFPKGLDFITSVYTNEPYYKDEGKMWKKIEGSIERFWLYNAKDVAVCLEAFPKQIAELRQLGNYETYCRQRDTIQQLAYMQHRGLRMDLAGMRQAAVESTTIINALEIELNALVQPYIQAYAAKLPEPPKTSKSARKHYNCIQRMCGGFNANSPDQVADYFYRVRGLTPYKSKGGGETGDEDALKRIARKGFPEAKLILDIRGEAKARGTYYLMQLDDDERLRCSMNPVGTKNGRFSSSKTIFARGGNMQNQPEKMLSFMLADPDCFLLSLDLEQAENRIVAVLANDEKMLGAFARGEDIHSLTASYILNKPVSEISDEKHTAPIGPKHWSERDLGKRTNHGLNYDMSYVKFALKNEMSEGDAKILIEKYHSIYPRVRGSFHYEVKQSIYDKRTLQNCFGRVRLFNDRIGNEVFREGYNFIPQSTVADIINEWGLNWIEEESCIGGAMECIEFLNQIHDSLVLQASWKDDLAVHASCLSRLIQNLEREITWKDRAFRIPVGMKIGLNLKDVVKIKLRGELGQHYLTVEDLQSALEKLRL